MKKVRVLVLVILLLALLTTTGFAFYKTRVQGKTREQTAVEISKGLYKYADTVIIVNGRNYPDALSGSLLSKVENAPILFVDSNRVTTTTINEIKRLRANKIIILGGPIAVSKKTENSLRKHVSNIKRISGISRLETSLNVLKSIKSKINFKTVALATGYGYADALTASSLTIKNNIPTLLIDPKGVDPRVISYLKSIGINKIYIIGGYKAISRSIENSLNSFNVERISGLSRYHTAINIAKKAYPNSNKVIVASAKSYADAMVAGVLTDRFKLPIILVDRYYIPRVVSNYVDSKNIDYFALIGGYLAISNKVEYQLGASARKFNERFINAFNKFRTDNGKKVLKKSLAAEKSAKLLLEGKNHELPIIGYIYSRMSLKYDKSPESLIEELAKDSGNKKVMLDSKYKEYGVSVKKGLKGNYSIAMILLADKVQVPPVKPVTDPKEFPAQVLKLVNAERAKRGIAPLKANASLNASALVRAKEIVTHFSHKRPDGSEPWTAINIPYSFPGENIAAGQFTPEMVVESWMKSDGHRENILNPKFGKLGVGYYYTSSSRYGHHWVQLFTD